MRYILYTWQCLHRAEDLYPYPYCIISCFVMCGCSVTTLFSFGCGMPVVQGAVPLQRVLTTEVRKSHCTHCLHKYSANVNQSVCNQIAAIQIGLSYKTAKYFFPLQLPLIYVLAEVSLAHCLPVADCTSCSVPHHKVFPPQLYI